MLSLPLSTREPVQGLYSVSTTLDHYPYSDEPKIKPWIIDTGTNAHRCKQSWEEVYRYPHRMSMRRFMKMQSY